MNLKGQLLIAMPRLSEVFKESVVLIIDHDQDGTSGVVINRPLDYRLNQLLKSLNLPEISETENAQVFWGGPVSPEVGFVVHDGKDNWGDSTWKVRRDLSVTITTAILESVSQGKGPANHQVCLGYANWGPGQLEKELAGDYWLLAPSNNAIIFKESPQNRYDRALEAIGLSRMTLHAMNGSSGHA